MWLYCAGVRAPTGGDDHPHESAVAVTSPPGGGQHQLSFGSQLRRLRLLAGLSRELLAERADVSVAAIAALEAGQRRRPHSHTVVALAEALGLDDARRVALLELASGPGPQREAAAPEPAYPVSRARLPVPPRALIGREADVAAATRQLDPARSAIRLLTLVGPGGVGKTRLALAVAGALVDAYPDGVTFVDLAPLRDQRLVDATIAHALELRGSGGRSARELLLDGLRERQLLLVLDNFEHLLGAAAPLAELLEGCPRLRLLVTSRAALRLRSEQRFPVAPLPAPTEEARRVEELADAPAVRLFVERAQAAAPEFRLDASNAHLVAAICRRLDGMPLAIELAAARAQLLRPEALLGRLERRLPLLTGGAPDLPERQQTLRQTLAWSHDLLGPAEQKLFRRLATFTGGWTLEAAEAICASGDAPADEVFEGLGALIDNSLVHQTVGQDQIPRFGMLETVREYALEYLQASGDEVDVRDRHLAFYSALAEDAEPHLHGPVQTEWADRLEHDFGNIRTALAWSERATPPVLGLRLATTLRYFWYMRGHLGEGRDRLEAGVAACGPLADLATRCRALNALGFLHAIQMEYVEGRERLEEALRISRELKDDAGAAFALRYLGLIASGGANYVQATALLHASLELFRGLDAPGDVGLTLMYLGDVALSEDDLGQARRFFEESSAMLALTQNRMVLPHPLRRLGQLAYMRGDMRLAFQLCMESFTYNRMVGDRRGVAASLVGLALIASTQQPVIAAQLLSKADAVLGTIGSVLLPFDQQQFQLACSRLRAQLEPLVWTTAWENGRRQTMDEAVRILETLDADVDLQPDTRIRPAAR